MTSSLIDHQRLSARTSSPTLLTRLGRRALGLVLDLFVQWGRLSYAITHPFSGLRGVNHITLPCHDLAVAEEFYVGLLGAKLFFRLDAAKLRQLGRPDSELPGAQHLSLIFAGGTRVDLFQNENGQPPADAPHPHVAFRVVPRELLRWKKRLEDRGVRCYGPRRLGPPGQASLYFYDPFGNHLELVALGFTDDIPIGYEAPAGWFAYRWSKS